MCMYLWCLFVIVLLFFKQKTAYEMRISDWSSDVCSSDLKFNTIAGKREAGAHGYGDHNSDWKATPEALRKAVDAYNGANQHTKDLYIEQIQREPKMARAVGQLIGERELILQR